MYVENITSNAMSLDRNGQSMLIQVYEKEIERLNNIIDGFERWLKEDLKNNYRDAGCRHSLIVEILDKLNELKDSD